MREDRLDKKIEKERGVMWKEERKGEGGAKR